MTTNEQLARQAIAGCQASRDLLVTRNMPLAIGIASRHTNPRNNDDIVAAATLGLVIAANTYNPDAGAMFSSYAHACISNEVFYTLRRDQSQQRRKQRLRDLSTPEMHVANDDPNERVAMVRALLDAEQLTPLERRVIEARYGIGCDRLTLMQLAAELGYSSQRVQQIEMTILKRLRKKVA